MKPIRFDPFCVYFLQLIDWRRTISIIQQPTAGQSLPTRTRSMASCLSLP